MARQRNAWRAFGIGLVTGALINASLLTFIVEVVRSASPSLLWIVGGTADCHISSARIFCAPESASNMGNVLDARTLDRHRILPQRMLVATLRVAATRTSRSPVTRGSMECARRLRPGFHLHGSRRARRRAEQASAQLGIAGLLLAALVMYWPPLPPTPADAPLQVAGVQTERWDDPAIADALDRLAKSHPEAQILVLSELRLFRVRARKKSARFCENTNATWSPADRLRSMAAAFTTPHSSSAPTAATYSARPNPSPCNSWSTAPRRRSVTYGIRLGAKSASQSATTPATHA